MFDLARQLNILGQNVRLLTGYPKFKVDVDLRGLARMRSRWVVPQHLLHRFPANPPEWLDARVTRDFAAWVAKGLKDEEVDIFDALDGGGLEAGRMVRDRGAVWVCNRGSAHVLTQKRLLEEEHRRWGVPMPRHWFLPASVDRCLAEYGGADAVITPSRFVARSFIEQGLAAEKVYVCPYGVDLSLFRPQPKIDQKFRVLFVGTQTIQKGIGYLFEAVRPLVEKGLCELWLVGQPGNDARRILHRNADLFQHRGRIPRAKLSWIYSQGSVLVLPSIQDGFGLVQAQAMACGVPVIASTNTGAQDLFTDGIEGFIVPIRQAQTLRDKIIWMLDNPKARGEMAAAALRRVSKLGGWNSYGIRSLEIYKGLIPKNGGSEYEESSWTPHASEAYGD